jgi:Ankyrin repeats (3 copies)
MFSLFSLPVELLLQISENVDARSYSRLRRTSRVMATILGKSPTLRFKQYKDSVAYLPDLCNDTYGRHEVHTPSFYSKHAPLRMKLTFSDLCDESVCYLADKGHAAEFLRLLDSPQFASKVSKSGVERALVILIENIRHRDWITSVLMKCQVDPNLIVKKPQLFFYGPSVRLIEWVCESNYRPLDDIFASYIRSPSIDINSIRDYDGETLATRAASSGNFKAVSQLLEFPTLNPNAGRTCSGDSLLHLAIHHGELYIVRKLLSHPFLDPNVPDNAGSTPLIYACTPLRAKNSYFKYAVAAVKLLLQDNRVDVNATSASGQTALHRACYYNQVDMVNLLACDPRFNRSARDNLGKMPIDYCSVSFKTRLGDAVVSQLRS